MSSKLFAVGVALAALMASPTASFAFGGLGCPDLPEYARAVGTIEMGPGACDMSLERARQIVAQENGSSAIEEPAAPAPRAFRRHHHHRRSSATRDGYR